MKVLLDECLPRKLKYDLPGHTISTAPEMGWAGIKNGSLLRLAGTAFEVFITADQNSASVLLNHSTIYAARLVLTKPKKTIDFTLRKAQLDDCAAIEQLIVSSARGLSRDDYSDQQIEAAIETVFGVDTDLILDGTYFVAEHAGVLIGCGGWSKRKTLFGGNQYAGRESGTLDPSREPAKIRAFFVHPDWARKGVGRALLQACEAEARANGFRALELMATLPGVKLYRALGYIERNRVQYQIGAGVQIEFVPMTKTLTTNNEEDRTMSMEANKAQTLRFYDEVWNGGNLDQIGTFIADNFIDRAAPPGAPGGVEGAKQVLSMYRTAFPDLHITVEDSIAMGDEVVVRWTSRGTNQGSLMGIPPSGAQVTSSGIEIYRFENGKMVEHWANFDLLGILQQIGVIPPPGQTAA